MTWLVVRLILALVVGAIALYPATPPAGRDMAVVLLTAGLITVLVQQFRRRHHSCEHD